MPLPNHRNQQNHRRTQRGPMYARGYALPPPVDPYANIPPELDLRNYTLEQQAAYYPSFEERLLMLRSGNDDIRLPEPGYLDSIENDFEPDYDYDPDHAGEW